MLCHFILLASSYILCYCIFLIASFPFVLDLISYFIVYQVPWVYKITVACKHPLWIIDLVTKLRVIKYYKGGKPVMIMACQSGTFHSTTAWSWRTRTKLQKRWKDLFMEGSKTNKRNFQWPVMKTRHRSVNLSAPRWSWRKQKVGLWC